jgi:hypothetical protein
MLLIIEVMLTVAVWRKGWKGWGLLPIGIVMLTGFAAGLAGMDTGDFLVPGLFLEGLAIAALCIMLKRAPKNAKAQNEEPAPLPAETLKAGA